MKKVSIVFVLLAVTAFLHCQSEFEWQKEFRQMTLDGHPDKLIEFDSLFSWADSLKSTRTSVYLDSLSALSADSVSGIDFLAFVEMEKYFYYLSIGKNEIAFNSLKRFQAAMEYEESFEPYYSKMNDYLAYAFEKIGEPLFANISLKRLYNQSLKLRKDDKQRNEMTLDSLNNALSAKNADMSILTASAEHDRKVYMKALAGAGLVFVLLLLAIFYSRWNLKKKITALKIKQQDTTELDQLTNKITEVKNEAQQFRNTAQLTVNKLNKMDVSNRKATDELHYLMDDINNALDELRQQCEINKAGISPPVYMAIQNTSARLGNSSSQKIQAIEEFLK